MARLVALALSAAACAPVPLLPYRPGDAPTVSAPLAAAGVRDERAAFAALFDEERRRSGPGDAAGAGDWLHGVAGRSPGATEAPAALRARFAERAGSTAVLVVPGLFGDCVGAQSVPFGDGVVRSVERSPIEAYGQYADLGLRSLRMVPLPGRASSPANGERLAQAIRAEASAPGVQRLVLVAYSKGVPDTLHALERLRRDGALPPGLVALVSVAGAVMGSPLADRFESLYDTASPWVTPLDCTPAQGGDLASVTRRERTAWMAAHWPPAPIAYYSVVAFASQDEMGPPLRAAAALLSTVDPRNDGQIVAADAILPGGTLLAEARADHWDVALPRNRDPNPWMRALASGRDFPREALFRAVMVRVVGAGP